MSGSDASSLARKTFRVLLPMEAEMFGKFVARGLLDDLQIKACS